MPNVIQLLRSPATTSRPTARLVGEPYVNFADGQFGVFDAAATDLIAVRYWKITASYETGDFVVNGGQLWVAKQAVLPGLFDPAFWDPIGVGPTLTVSDTPPANPNPGDLWWHSDSGWMFIYYQDIDSVQWVAT